MTLFEPGERTDVDPAAHGESHWAYLNRSARSEFSRVRDQMNGWFGRLCAALQPGVRTRIQSGEDQEFVAAYWELYLHEMFVRLGYDVECEPALPNGRNIDFLVSRHGQSMYVEATIARSSAKERAADARRNRLYEQLNRVRTDAFMLGIQIEQAGAGDVPNLALLRDRLEGWLAQLDPDTAAATYAETGEFPVFAWESAGWILRFDAYPVKRGRRGGRIGSPLGYFMDETGGLIDDATRLRGALKRKAASRYGDLEVPYVVAISEYGFELGDPTWHRKNVFYGQEGVAFGDGTPARSIRRADGYWRGPGQRPQNRRLAAVLLCTHLYPWRMGEAELEWWENSFAQRPVPEKLVPAIARRRQLELRGSEGEFVTTEPSASAADLFAGES